MAHYQTLRDRVSEKFSQIEANHRSSFVCKNGCHSCCKPDLTVSPIEAQAIGSFLADKTLTFEPYGKSRCSFLTKQGACAIYEARPLVCRSHGAPLQYFEQDTKSHFRDVCPLNFTDKDLTSIAAEDVMNLDTLNMLLATLNVQAFGKKVSSQRISLNETAIRDFSKNSAIL